MNKKPKSKEGGEFQVDKDGSLGLLALGDIGLDIWRKAKLEYNKSIKKAQDD